MKVFVNTVRPLFSYVVKVVFIMMLVVSFTLPAYAQEKLWNELNDKSDTHYQQGQYSEAVNVAKEALKVAEKTFGPDHPDVATSLNNLAVLYQAQGKYNDAESLFKRALKIVEKALGPDHPYVATTLETMAELYRKIGEKEEAKRLEERAGRIRSKYR